MKCSLSGFHNFTSGIIFILLASIPALTQSKAVTPESTAEGLALAQKAYDRPAGEDASSRVVMLLTRKGATPQKRLLFTYAKDKGDSRRWILMRFVEPKNVDQTGLLTLDYPGEESHQWLYLPALKRVRRISSTRKGGRFVGSDFYYEDLMDREVGMDHHRLIGTDKVGGVPCTLLESTPVTTSNSVYSKRVSCIYTKIMAPLRIDFYQKRNNKPIKRLQAKKIKKVQGYWTIFESTMVDLKTGHSTKLLTTDIKYDQGIPDELFTQQGLSDESREIKYRPN